MSSLNVDSTILNSSKLDQIEGEARSYLNTLNSITEGVVKAITAFESNQVVISLVNSGKLGSDIQNNLTKIRKNLSELSAVANEIYEVTCNYVDSQRSYISRSFYS